MEETRTVKRKARMRHRGRNFQVGIYLGKIVRIFLYQNDWKVLPMSAAVAGMVAIVIRGGMFRSMEKTLTGALALACVSIWNGFFNSIQVICRERGIIKREHRAGMHITSYVAAHMIFQAALCVVQSIITIYVCMLLKVTFPTEGLITTSFLTDLFISLFLITYAADLLSLFISSVVHSTTTAMTVMPFILIFQLVFSGGIFTLPRSVQFLQGCTISHYGLQCIAAQSGYNELPMQSAWNTLDKMKNSEIEADVTVEQIVDTFNQSTSESAEKIKQTKVNDTLTVLDVISLLTNTSEYAQFSGDRIPVKFSVSDVIDLFGEQKVKKAVDEKSRDAGQNSAYDKTVGNVISCWMPLILMILLFAVLTVLALELIDKDKR